MSSTVAIFVVSMGILGLFWLNRDPKTRTSIALWIPVTWLLINGSRPISQWLQMAPPIDTPDAVLDGSPLDALVFSILLAAGLAVMLFRARQVGALLRENKLLIIFFLYCAVSVLWSDYPFVAFKRWWKAIGDMVMVMIVLTDADRAAALKRLLSRTGFILLPFSVVLIRYFPNLGRGYDRWEGNVSYTGVATNKNMLGVMCLVMGLGALWQFLSAYRTEKSTARTRHLLAQGILVAIVVWLFFIADSVTSMACGFLAAMLVVLTSFPFVARSRALINFLVAGTLLTACAPIFLTFASGVLEMLGRDPTLTGRTEIWSLVLSLAGNPFFGTGYESFWLGSRLDQLWGLYHFPLNEAHNGYIEIYLNLGWIGIAMLAGMMVAGYGNIVGLFRRDPDTARLRLAYFVAGAAFSLTEAGFRMMSLSWIFFLLALTSVPKAPVEEPEPVLDATPRALWTPVAVPVHATASQRKSL